MGNHRGDNSEDAAPFELTSLTTTDALMSPSMESIHAAIGAAIPDLSESVVWITFSPGICNKGGADIEGSSFENTVLTTGTADLPSEVVHIYLIV